MREKDFKKRIYKSVLSIALFCFLIFPIHADLFQSGKDITVHLDPAYPSANQIISAKLETYVTDINYAEILWFVDGKLKKRGIGETEFSFGIGDFGETTILDIQINSSDIGGLNKKVKITPTEIDLIWEADTFAPPFYKGKALSASEAVITVVALPNFVNSSGKKISPENLIYKWKKDWKIIGDKSGYGKKSFSFIGPRLFGQNSITVEAESLDGNLKGKKSVSISPKKTEIVFYENDPLLGILDNLAIMNKYNLSDEELNLTAYPFFFSLQNLTDLEYNWRMNNNAVNNSGREIIFRKTGDETGESSVFLKIQNLDKITQFAENSFKIDFETDTTSENYFDF